MPLIEVKCPYCQEWNVMSQYDFDVSDVHDCMNCFHRFFIDDSIAQNMG